MKLHIFVNPLDSSCILYHDAGSVTAGVPNVIDGREGFSFELPPNTPSGWGARLEIKRTGFVTLVQRGILYQLGDNWVYFADDFTLSRIPDPVIIEKPVPVPTPIPYPMEPLGIIELVYKLGRFDLTTKEGCGKFTEACCNELHKNHSSSWGHIRKFGAQNQYNGHAVDAVMLLSGTMAGVYDLILDSESVNAKPQFIYKGVPDPNLWYYPA